MMKNWISLLSVVCTLGMIIPSPSYALVENDPLLMKKAKEVQPTEPPLEITADESLEWDRNAKIFRANTKAMAKQGDVSIEADVLEAHYREGKESSMELYKMYAKGNVKVTSNDSIAYGDNAEYDIDEGLAVMTGKDLKMTSADQTLTARENFEYWVVDGRLVANGSAKIVRPKKDKSGSDTLEAAHIYAYLKDNNKGKRVLDRMVAEDNVVITTPTEILTGAKATYAANTNVAELNGNVKITRGQNKLEGSRATVDLNTNISRMFGSSSSSGSNIKRVRGTFYPGSTKSNDENEDAQKTETKFDPYQEKFNSIDIVPQSVRRVRPKQANDEQPQTFEPVKLKMPESMKEELEEVHQGEAVTVEEQTTPHSDNVEVQLLKVPDNKTPEPLSGPLTSPTGNSSRALE